MAETVNYNSIVYGRQFFKYSVKGFQNTVCIEVFNEDNTEKTVVQIYVIADNTIECDVKMYHHQKQICATQFPLHRGDNVVAELNKVNATLEGKIGYTFNVKARKIINELCTIYLEDMVSYLITGLNTVPQIGKACHALTTVEE